MPMFMTLLLISFLSPQAGQNRAYADECKNSTSIFSTKDEQAKVERDVILAVLVRELEGIEGREKLVLLSLPKAAQEKIYLKKLSELHPSIKIKMYSKKYRRTVDFHGHKMKVEPLTISVGVHCWKSAERALVYSSTSRGGGDGSAMSEQEFEKTISGWMYLKTISESAS